MEGQYFFISECIGIAVLLFRGMSRGGRGINSSKFQVLANKFLKKPSFCIFLTCFSALMSFIHSIAVSSKRRSVFWTRFHHHGLWSFHSFFYLPSWNILKRSSPQEPRSRPGWMSSAYGRWSLSPHTHSAVWMPFWNALARGKPVSCR